jgi:hypothetical protein
MAISVETGPLVTAGNLNPVQDSEPGAGANLWAKGDGLVDPRYVSSIGTAPGLGRVLGLYSSPIFSLVDGFPQAPQAAGIASIAPATAIATAAAGGTAVPLVATNGNLGFNINVPIVPWVTTRNTTNPTTDGKVSGYGLSSTPGSFVAANVVNTLALDFGSALFTLPAAATITATPLTSNASSPGSVHPSSQSGASFPANQILTVLAASNTAWKNPLKFYYPGQWVIVPGAGNAAGTSCLITQVVAYDYVQKFLVIANPCLNTAANNTGVGVGSADPQGIAAWPYLRTGDTALYNPAEGITRNLSVVSSNAADTAMLFTIQGYDIWGLPMTEQITSNGTTPVLGNKAFKYISAITVSHAGSFSTTGTVTVGTPATNTGALGLPVYIDQFEYLEIFANGALVSANTGFTAGLTPTTNPATYTTADNRGTYVMGTAPTGSVHYVIYADMSQSQAARATNLYFSQLFGLTQT